jgi:hypothetical protein
MLALGFRPTYYWAGDRAPGPPTGLAGADSHWPLSAPLVPMKICLIGPLKLSSIAQAQVRHQKSVGIVLDRRRQRDRRVHRYVPDRPGETKAVNEVQSYSHVHRIDGETSSCTLE